MRKLTSVLSRLHAVLTFALAIPLSLPGSLILSAFIAPGAFAQAYPARPVHLYLPIPAGGGVDILARAVARSFVERTGQPMVVENRPGGNFTIALSG